MSDNFLNEKPPYTTANLSTLASSYGVNQTALYTFSPLGSVTIDGVSYNTYGCYQYVSSGSTGLVSERTNYGTRILHIYKGTNENDLSFVQVYDNAFTANNETYLIKRFAEDTIGVETSFLSLFDYVYIRVNSKYIPYVLESDITSTYSRINEITQPTKTAFDPFEPLNLSGISVSVTKNVATVNSAISEVTSTTTTAYDTWDRIVEASNGNVVIPSDGYYSEPGSYVISATFSNGSSASWAIDCNEWKSKTYSIEKSGIAVGDYKIYPEQEIPVEFFSDYSLYLTKTSNYSNQSSISTVQTSLELSRMTPQIMPEGVLTYDFDYDIADLTETEDTIVSCSITDNLVLGDNTIRYSNFKITKEPSKVDYIVNLSINDQPKYDYDSPGFDFSDIEATINENTWLNGVITNTEVKNLTFADLTITHQKIYMDGNCTCTATYSVNNDGTTSSYSANFKINITLLRYVLVTEGTTDADTYFADYNSNLFHYPNGVFVALNYNDISLEGKEYGTDSFNATSFYYYLDEACTQGIVVGDVIPNYITKIYYRLKANSGVEGSYNLSYIADNITSLELVNTVDFTLGNELTKSDFKIKATYSSSKVDENFINYSFCDAEGNTFTGMILEPQDIYIRDNLTTNKVYTISKENITWHEPAISDVEILLNNTPLSYNNKIDSLDLTKVTALITYENARYTQTVEFQASTTLSDDKHFYLSTNDEYFSTYDYANPTPIAYSMPTGYESIYVNIIVNVLNRFTGDKHSSKVIRINIIDILDITGLSLERITNEYSVGDSFLNENDNTRVRIFYNDLNGSRKSMSINLRDGNAALNIYPPKDTVFNYTDRNVDVTISAATNYNVQVKYNISVSTKYNYTNTKTHVLKAILVENNVRDPNGNVIVTNYSTTKGGVYMLVDRSSNDDKYYGYLDDLFDESKSAKMILFDDYVPPIEGDSNITALYPCYVVENADKINKCHFGILFGSNNATNRLFVSGNHDVPNADWHSSAINNTNVEGERMKDSGNFSFISDTSIMYYGETDNEIVGYDIVSNDKLLVLKNKSDKEKTVYFRTPALVTALDSSGATVTDVNNQILYQEEFSLVKGNNATAGINPRAITNFNGDTVFLDAENHLVGLDLVGIIGDSQRYANSRSVYIDNKIKEYDLSKSFLWTNNKYLFFPIKDYGTFVTHYETLADGQYEWWYVTDKNPTVFMDYNNEIYFGNDEGNFYKILKSSFVDRDKLYINEKNSILASIDPLENEVVVSYDIIDKLDSDKNYKFKVSTSDDLSKAIYSYLGLVSNSGSPDFMIKRVSQISETVIELVNNNKEYSVLLDKDIYLDYAPNYNEILQTQKVYETYTPYRLELVEIDGVHNECFRLLKKDINGEWVKTDLQKLTEAILCYKLDGEYSIINIDKENSTFQLADGEEIVDIERYAGQNQTTEYSGEIIHESNVEAFYITAPFTMGSLQSFKTIWSYTLTNDTNLPSELELSYASNKLPSKATKTLALISKEAFGVNFDTLDFKKIDFDKTIVPRTYTMQRTLPLQKFICFCFRNLSDTNAVLSTLNVTYTIPYPSYGKD